MAILSIYQSKDSSQEDFELLQQKIEQLKEAEKVKRTKKTMILLLLFSPLKRSSSPKVGIFKILPNNSHKFHACDIKIII